MICIEQLIQLAKEIEAEDPIDWSDLPLPHDVVYKMLACGALEHLEGLSGNEREIVMTATIIKLVVENFVLELKQNSGK